MRSKAVAALALALCGACATPRALGGYARGEPRDADEIRAAVERTWDPYRRLETLRGPTQQRGEISWSLVRTRERDDPELIELDCAWSGETWRFLESAFDIEGRQLDLRVVDRGVTAGARVAERVRVRLPRPLLEEPRDGPLKLRLFGAKGHVDVELPRHYVRGFLDALERR